MSTDYFITLEQGVDFIHQLTDKQYIEIAEGFDSAIGCHVRHILDHFYSVKQGLDLGYVDYEFRRRGALVETCRNKALEQFREVQQWLTHLTEASLIQNIMVKSDIGIGRSHIVQVQSTLARELMFACSHAIHHYATLKLIFQRLGGEFNEPQFGIAPSTATFNRKQPCVR